MKRTALILLLIFGFVQAGPAVTSIFTGGATVFIVDEEKNNSEKTENDKKEKKDFSCQNNQQTSSLKKISQHFFITDKLYSHPCIEQQTPPPNYIYILA